MNNKRIWIKHSVWFLFSVYIVYFMIQTAEQMAGRLAFLPEHTVLAQVGYTVLILMVTGICGLVVYGAGILKGRKPAGKVLSMIPEALYWLFVGSVSGVRFIYQLEWWSLFHPYGPASGTVLVEQALIQSGGSDLGGQTGVSAFYVKLLSLFFSFVGNNREAVFYFQLVIQILTVVVLYFALRILCGKITAYVTGIILITCPWWMDAVMQYQPEVISMFLWSFLLLILALWYRSLILNRSASPGASGIGCLLVGTISGWLIGLDRLGLLLLPIIIFILFMKGGRGKEKNLPLWGKAGILTLGIGLGGALLFYLEAVVTGTKAVWVTEQWLLQFANFKPSFAIPAASGIWMVMLSGMAVFMGMWAISYWLDEKREVSLWILAVLCLTILLRSDTLAIGGSGRSVLDSGMWSLLIGVILAGMGLQKMMEAGLTAGRSKMIPVEEAAKQETTEQEATGQKTIGQEATQKEITKKDTAKKQMTRKGAAVSEPGQSETLQTESASQDKKAEQSDGIKWTHLPKNKATVQYFKPKSDKKQESGQEKKPVNRMQSNTKQENKSQEESRYDTSTGTRYIENPLPLPPKPVRKGMEFPHAVPPDQMHYDMEVPVDSDYDY